MEARWAQRMWPPLIAAVCVVGVAVLSLFVRPVFRLVPARNGPAYQPRGGVDGPLLRAGGLNQSHHFGTFPAWLADLILILLAAVIIGAVIVGLVGLLRKSSLRLGRLHGDAPVDHRQAVLDAVDAGIADLLGPETDPRSAVIACWVRLERVAAAVGIDRRAGETPSDLVASLLEQERVSADALTSLAELYRVARYSTRVIESSMRDDARDALGRLRAELLPGPRTSAPVAAG